VGECWLAYVLPRNDEPAAAAAVGRAGLWVVWCPPLQGLGGGWMSAYADTCVSHRSGGICRSACLAWQA
jgi:hypothetical protein